MGAAIKVLLVLLIAAAIKIGKKGVAGAIKKLVAQRIRSEIQRLMETWRDRQSEQFRTTLEELCVDLDALGDCLIEYEREINQSRSTFEGVQGRVQNKVQALRRALPGGRR